MGGLIKVWKVESKEEIWSFEVGDLEVKLCLFSWCIWEHSLGSLFFFFLTGAGGIYEETREFQSVDMFYQDSLDSCGR